MPEPHFLLPPWEFRLAVMLSMKAKYALRAMTILAHRADALLPARQIAVDARVPEKFLEAILLDLRHAGFIRSRRGPDGGHGLARAAEQIVLGDLIRAIDGPLAPIRCASLSAYRPCDDCPDPAQCAERKLMAEVRDAISSVLDGRSLHDHLQRDECQIASQEAVATRKFVDTRAGSDRADEQTHFSRTQITF